jgi:SPP1 family predicted phage head-tail adaptor
MKIGQLRHFIAIQSRREVMTDTGGTSITFENVYQCYADVKPVSGYVSFDTKQIGEKVTHTLRIRHHPHVTTENWILWQQKRFRIRSVIDVGERHRWLDLLCEHVEVNMPEFETDTSCLN